MQTSLEYDTLYAVLGKYHTQEEKTNGKSLHYGASADPAQDFKLRDKNTGTNEFRKLVEEIAVLMGYEAFRDLPTEDVEIETPIETCKTPFISGKKLAVIPVLVPALEW